jgi:hypothetical protein
MDVVPDQGPRCISAAEYLAYVANVAAIYVLLVQGTTCVHLNLELLRISSRDTLLRYFQRR